MNDKNIIAGALVLMVAVGAILYAISGNTGTPTGASTKLTQEASSTVAATGPNLALAQCLKDKGVVFYGAFWCPHCKKQKELFSEASPALPYVECSTPDGNDQTQICKDKGIHSYPTWKFPGRGELTGEQQLATLAASSSCSQALSGHTNATPDQLIEVSASSSVVSGVQSGKGSAGVTADSR